MANLKKKKKKPRKTGKTINRKMTFRDKIAVMLSMTRTEITVISSLLLFFILGIIVNSSRSLQEAGLFMATEQTEQFTDAEVDGLLREAALLEAALAKTGAQAPHIQEQKNVLPEKSADSPKIVFSNATADELAAMPGISSVLANRLITFRGSRQGKVERFQDFLEVKGIGRKRMKTLEQHLILD